jgi:hypothetical protein
MPRDLHRLGSAFVVRAIRPGAWQIPVFVTVLGADLHEKLVVEAVEPSKR